MTASNTIYSVFSFTGFLLCAIPFTWHLKHQNTGTCFFMAWSGITCLCQSINSIIWNANMVNWSPVWCDIVTKICIGSSVGIPASSLCIFRRLHGISIAQGTIPTANKSVRRHRVMIDLALGLGLPCLEMILAYIAQGHRYDIREDIGCTPPSYITPVFLALNSIPPILIGLVTMHYAVLTIIAFNRRRVEFNNHLAQHSNLSSSYYLRLICFGCFEILGTVPLASYFLHLAISNGVEPWNGWENVHSHFSNVPSIPRSAWSKYSTSNELNRWISVICAFIFFAFFGFAEEARTHYRAAYLTVAKYIGLSTASSKSKPSATPRVRNDIEALVFAHSTTTNISIPIPAGENHNANKKEDQTPQVITTSANTFLNADVNNCDLYPIPPTLPEPAVTKC